jgi:DNA modification methylase
MKGKTPALYYGDNLEVLRKKIGAETVDLCYIDPPFNSKRNYNQIYNNVGDEDRAQAQAFMDTWKWDDLANQGYQEIIANADGRFQPRLIELIKGLRAVLTQGDLLAYLVSISLRATEIFRVLKPTGSFYFHCDPTASHYLKLVLDSIFCPQGGDFQNEIIWSYQTGGASKRRFARKHDVILFYTKSDNFTFNSNEIREPRTEKSLKRAQNPTGARITVEDVDKLPTDVFQIPALNPMAVERLGYPTQKPEALLARIIMASSNEGDVVLDAYCGCGTTVAVAQRLKRKWIGIDITFQSISLVLRRLEKAFGPEVVKLIMTDGIPRDMRSAQSLAHRQDDRLRKEFEKWTVLTYTNNRAVINEKKGADAGIDARAYFMTGKSDNAKVIFQVKSGGVKRGDIATLRGDMGREDAALAVLITLEDPSKPMVNEAKAAGQYRHETMGRNYDRIGIVTVQEILDGARLELPMSVDVVKAAKEALDPDRQPELF